jgi:hypothetical protein
MWMAKEEGKKVEFRDNHVSPNHSAPVIISVSSVSKSLEQIIPLGTRILPRNETAAPSKTQVPDRPWSCVFFAESNPLDRVSIMPS